MIAFDLTTAVLLTVAVALVAVVGVALAATSAGRFVAANRRVRLARHESLRSYYGGLILSH